MLCLDDPVRELWAWLSGSSIGAERIKTQVGCMRGIEQKMD
jgi:hypothetical protein